MNYGFFDILLLAGSLGIFIYGMKIMSEGLQKAAGESLRKVLKGMTANRFSGIFTGFFTTAVIQSSSATTVMVVSFVNAGLLTLRESMGVIMGANIGTTITAWLIAIFGFKVMIYEVAIIAVGVAFPFLFSKKSSYRHIAEFFMGFGILFIGLNLLKDSVPDINSNAQILEFITRLTQMGFGSILLFILIGTVLTIVVQSSTASMAITLVLLYKGWIDFPIAAAMVMGENIGTTVTANIAALAGNIHAKRAARFHSIFNILGIFWMVLTLNYFLAGIDFMITQFLPGHISVFQNSEIGRENATVGLALFHTGFNVLNTLLLFAFIPFFEKLVIKMQSPKSEDDEIVKLQFLSTGMMQIPELALAEAKKELQFFGKVIEKMSFSFNALVFENPQNAEAIIQKIKKREQLTDDLEIALVNYLTKVSESDLSQESSQSIPSMLSMANDLERIADIYYQMTKNYERMTASKIKYPVDVMHDLKELLELVYEAIKLMRSNMEKEKKEISMKQVFEVEERINTTRRQLRKSHFKRLEKNIYDAQAGVIFLDYVTRAERIGDHLVNVNEALVGIK